MSNVIFFSQIDNVDKLSTIPIQIEHLQTLKAKLIENTPTLNMATYITSFDRQTLCATSCCMAGWGMEWKIGTTPKMDANWSAMKKDNAGTSAAYDYGLFLVGHPADTMIPDKVIDDNFTWLFGGNWPNSIDQAIERIDYFLKHKSSPAFVVSEFYTRRTSYTEISLLDLMKQLPNSKYLELADTIDYDGLNLPYTLIDIDCHCAVTERIGMFTCPLIKYDSASRACESAILVHDDDVDMFNQLTTSIQIVERGT